MKAAVWTGVDKIEIKDIPMPTLNEGEALIKVRVAGVCVTDYHVISGKLKIGVPPNVQGHEICGEIVKINGESSLKIGERCVIATSLGCGECEYNHPQPLDGSVAVLLPGAFTRYQIP